MNARQDPENMAGRAVIARKPRKMTAKLHRALTLLVKEGKTQRDAASEAGMGEAPLSRALRRPEVRAELDRMKLELIAEVEPLKRIARAQAIQVGMDLMWNSPSHAVRARMVEFFAGEPRNAASVSIHMPAIPKGYEFDAPTGPMRDVTPGPIGQPDGSSGGEEDQAPDK